MRICRLEDNHEASMIDEIKKGAVFIYPTDTVYGIGCNALKTNSVKNIRKIKKSKKPFSVIAPTKKWIIENLRVRDRSQLKRLPGRYTLIFEKRRRTFLREASSENTLGVRIPKHDFTRLVKRAGVPFVTTSVNVSGKKHAIKISNIPRDFLKHVDFVIDSGVLKSSPSRVLDLTGSRPKRLR